MIDRIANNPWLLGGAFLASGVLGAGLFAAAQALVPGANPDKAKIESVVRAYLLENPEILPEAMERLQAKEALAQQKAANEGLKGHSAEVVKPYGGAWTGNPKGDVTVVAFMDYNCGYCRASLPTLAKLAAADPGIRIVYREYPVLGAESTEAARWALAAADQNKFKPFHEALYEGLNFDAAAAKAGLDIGQARAALRSPRVSGEIAANRKIGYDLRLTGTPGFVIGKTVYHGAMDYASFVKAVAAARASK